MGIPFMKRFLSIAMALCIGLTMSLDANAKRFGGGKSSGAAPTHQTSQMAPSAGAVSYTHLTLPTIYSV